MHLHCNVLSWRQQFVSSQTWMRLPRLELAPEEGTEEPVELAELRGRFSIMWVPIVRFWCMAWTRPGIIEELNSPEADDWVAVEAFFESEFES
eukprot:g63217.t1